MLRLVWLLPLVVPVHAQAVGNAADLLQEAKAFGESTRSWKAEVVETTHLSGPGMNLQSEIHTKVAAQPSLKMARQNSGDDQTVMVCDGTETFYSGDGHSYFKNDARATPQCNLPLIDFYQPYNDPVSAEIVGEDHVLLAEGDRRCVVIRAVFMQASVHVVRTMCIDPSQPVILRDVLDAENEKLGIKSLRTTTFVSFKSDPVFSPDTFRFNVPQGAVEAKPSR